MGKLIVSWKTDYYLKNLDDRIKSVEKLKGNLKSSSQKECSSNLGYRKYLKLEDKSTISLNCKKNRDRQFIRRSLLGRN